MSMNESLNVQCPSCGTQNPPRKKFCWQCGKPLIIEAQSEPPSMTNPQPQVQQMGGNVGTSISNPFEGKGQRMEGWADLVEDAGEVAPTLINAFHSRLANRSIPNTNVQLQELTAAGIIGERRRYFIITRDVATVAVYIAGFGKDLYVSWVLFAQGEVAAIRLSVLGLLALLFAFPSSIRVNFFAGTQIDPSSLVGNTIIMFIVLFVIAAVIGYLRQRDAFALLRGSLNEFQQDDLLALALAVHKSLLHAIDTVGISSSLLRAKLNFSVSERGRII